MNEISSPNVEFDETAYQDADSFEKNIRTSLTRMTSNIITGRVDPLVIKNMVNDMLNMAGEVAKFSEVQKTKRKEIEAKRDIIVEKIHSQKEIILSYLDKSFDERRENFSKLFSLVDNAITNNNIQQLAMGLDSINKLAASSPFKELASLDTTKLALHDESHEWDF
jgi:hypothetical protein